jgi:MFS family permease
MESPRLSEKPKLFYGYWIVVATFFCLFIVSGCGFFAFSLFVRPLQTDLGWGRGDIMAAFTIFYLVVGVASPFIGRVVDRYGARRVISTGALIAGLGFISLSLVNSLWHFHVSYAIIGIGMTAMGQVPSSAIVSNWFKKRRGTAIGIMSSGIGAGGFVLAPIVGGYIIPSFGWRVAYLVLATLTWALVIPLALLVMKTKPADMRLHPDGEQIPDTMVVTEALPLAAKGITLQTALTTSAFWLISTSFLTGLFSQVGVLQHQVPYLEDIGFPVALASSALGVVGLMSAIGKFVFGWLCDRIPAKYVWSIGLGFQSLSVIILINVEPASHLAIIWLYAIMIGLGAGSWLPTMSMLVSTNFGLAAYGAIFGTVTLFECTGVATGPLMAGYMYDAMGNYHWAFIILLTLNAVALPTALAVRRPKSLQDFKEE